MKIITLSLGMMISNFLFASEYSEWLIKNNPNNYFPSRSEFFTFPTICNNSACFNLVSASYVSISNKGVHRIAVFSGSGAYLGSYSGFQELPVKVRGSKLLFPLSEYGNTIDFETDDPPETVYIDGESFEFEPRP